MPLLPLLFLLACEPDDACTDRRCAEGSGGPPVDACRPVGGDDRCVLLCESADDCLADFHPSGCTGVADDGSAYCE